MGVVALFPAWSGTSPTPIRFAIRGDSYALCILFILKV